MTLPGTITPKLAKLIPMLATDSDGEALATCRAIGRTLRSAGVDFHALAAAVVEPDADVRARRREAAPSSDLDVWENLVRRALVFTGRLSRRDIVFLGDMRDVLARGHAPTMRQAQWLRDIGDRIIRWEGTP